MNDYFNLKGKVALVTGGSRGIGRAISLALAQAGAEVIINYLRHKSNAEETLKEIIQKGGKAKIIKANVGEEQQIDNLFSELAKEYNHIDFIISNAVSGVLKPILEIEKKHWDWTMNINAVSLLILSKKVVSFMNNGGRIIAITSLGSQRVIPDYGVVGASKAALEALIRYLAVELAPKNIIVNAICPGFVETDSLNFFPKKEEMIKESLRKTPIGSLTTPEDIANVVLFLCSPLSEKIIGQIIVVDGGYSILS